MTWEDNLEKSGMPLIFRKESLCASADTVQRAGGQAIGVVKEKSLGLKKILEARRERQG